jgi:[acyl-carrier-protein] S-malonyltransferase
MESCVFAFPSRESLASGISRTFYDEHQIFRETFDEASEFLKEDLFRLTYIDRDSKPWLKMVCLLTHCYGVERILRKEGVNAHAYFGLSQGEFTAITAAGCVSFPQILLLIAQLDKLILENPGSNDGAMARVVGLNRAVLKMCCKKADPTGNALDIAVCFSDEQNVISGQNEAVQLAGSYAKEAGARWIISLGNSLAFHSPYCKSLGEKSLPFFDMLEYRDIKQPVYLCTYGAAETDGGLIKKSISAQISAQVVFDKVISCMEADGVNRLIELGAGCSISGNTRIISSKIKCSWVNDTSDLSKLLSHR